MTTLRKTSLAWLIFLSLALSACQGGPTSTIGPGPGPSQTATAAGYAPKYEKADCPFTKPSDVTVECGYLVVPEDRANPQGRSVRLAVARFKAALPNPSSDPIVYLEGGPGGSPLRSYAKNFTSYFDPFAQKRDVILFDQRGTGYSQPALDCFETSQLTLDQLDEILTPEQQDQTYNQALQACRDRLKAQGIDLGAYNSAANAADLADLRKALGIKEWNLYGISYGTRLALTALRDAKEGIRSVVIDSVYPPQANLVTETPASLARALNLLFDACAADSACNGAYPNLKEVLFTTAKRLNASPAKIKITQPDLGSIGVMGQQLDALFDGNSLLGLIFQLLYSSEAIPSIPALIYQAQNNQFSLIAQMEGRLLGQLRDMSQGMYFSVECFEEVPFTSLDQAEAAYQAQPELAGALGTAKGTFDACQVWNVPAASVLENQPVKSDVPTLVVSGQFDPVTPPAWGRMAVETLSKGRLIEVPGAGHGSTLSVECPQKIALAFLDNPDAAPDTACLQKSKVTFTVPVDQVDIQLAPFDSRLMGISALVPATWKSAGGLPGFYTPDGSSTNFTQLLIQAGAVSLDQILTSMTNSLKEVGMVLVPSTQKFTVQSAGGLKWNFYEADGGLVQLDMALANNGKTTFIVLLQSPWNERQALLKAVFVPIVEAVIGQ